MPLCRFNSYIVAFTALSSNGCRAPVERQLLGDIAYLEIQLTGFDLLYVTASEYGYYVIHVSFQHFPLF